MAPPDRSGRQARSVIPRLVRGSMRATILALLATLLLAVFPLVGATAQTTSTTTTTVPETTTTTMWQPVTTTFAPEPVTTTVPAPRLPDSPPPPRPPGGLERLLDRFRDLGPVAIGLVGIVALLGLIGLGFVRSDFPVTGALGRWWNLRPVRAAERAAAAEAVAVTAEEHAHEEPQAAVPPLAPEPTPALELDPEPEASLPPPIAAHPWTPPEEPVAADGLMSELESEPDTAEAITIEPDPVGIEPVGIEPVSAEPQPEPVAIEPPAAEPQPEPVAIEPVGIEPVRIEPVGIEAEGPPPEPVVAGGIAAAMAAATAAQQRGNGSSEPSVESGTSSPAVEVDPAAELSADPFEAGVGSAVVIAREVADRQLVEDTPGDGDTVKKVKQSKPARVDRPTVGERFLDRFQQSPLGRWWMGTEWGETMRANAEGKRLQEAIEERRRSEDKSA